LACTEPAVYPELAEGKCLWDDGPMSEIKDLTAKIAKIRDDRDWKQFHNPKDMAVSLALEANEVLEHFQWRNGAEMDEYVKTHKEEIGEELADVLYWVL
jgi:NTP pyrophosphatase (non-canonical NTP hydrolase)